MTEKDRAEAFEYIEAQLNDGYIDLGLHDDNELVIVKEAINLLKNLDKFNSIGCTSFYLSPEEIQNLKENGKLRPYDHIWDMYIDEFEDEEVT